MLHLQTSKDALAHIMSKTITSILGQAMAGAISIWCLYFAQNSTLFTLLWGVAISLLLMLRFWVYRDITIQLKQNPRQNIRLTLFHVNILLLGLTWGVGFAYFVHIAPDALLFLPMAIAATLVGGAILTLSVSFYGYMLFTLPLTVNLSLSYLLIPETSIALPAAIASFIGALYLSYTAYLYSRNFKALAQQNRAIQQTQMDLVHTLGRAAEYRDEETGNHVLRMSHACYLLAKQLGFSEPKALQIYKASSLHDIGKIGIPDNILLKPGKLTEDERKIIETHPQIGINILQTSDSELIKLARTIIQSHHEKWDGSGYPEGKQAEQIPMPARIAAVCDVFDALISDRPYKTGWPHPQALDYLKTHSGTHFDPQVVQAFEVIYPEVCQFANLHADRQQHTSPEDITPASITPVTA